MKNRLYAFAGLVAALALVVYAGWAILDHEGAPDFTRDPLDTPKDPVTQRSPERERPAEQPILDARSPREKTRDLHERIAELERALEQSRAENRDLKSRLATKGRKQEAEQHGDVAITELTGQALLERMRSATNEELRTLEDIDLRGAKLTKEDLELVTTLPRLRHLGLRSTNITDDGLAVLAEIPLVHLDLRGTKITGAGLVHLSRDLESLHLTNTRVDPRDFDRLPHMARLKTLKLNGINLGDAAIERIGQLANLEHLEIDRTAITHEGLARLLELNPRIRRIEARGAPVSASAARELSASHPGLEIVRQSAMWGQRPR